MITEELLSAYEYVHTIFLILSVLTNSTLILLILRFSPKKMHSYRLYLLNLTVANATLSLYIDGILRIVHFSSTNLTLLRGPIRLLGHDATIPAIAILVFLAGWLIFSLGACFIYRYATVAKNRFAEAVLHFRGVVVTFSTGLALCLVMALLAWLSILTNYQLVTAYFLALEPNLLKTDSDPLIFGFNKFITVFAVALPVSLLLFVVIVVTSSILTVRSLHVYRHHMSASTYHLHKQLTISLFVQCLYPILTGLIPMSIGFIYQVTRWPSIAKSSDWFMFVVFAIIFSYPAIDPLITIFMVGPYRMALFYYIKLAIRCGRRDALDTKAEDSPTSIIFQRRTKIAAASHRRHTVPMIHGMSVNPKPGLLPTLQSISYSWAEAVRRVHGTSGPDESSALP